MRLCDATQLWAATPLRGRDDFEPVTIYINLRPISANIQTDHSELDLQQYGNTVNELIKLRFITNPDLANDDMIYLTKPTGTAVTIDNQNYTDFGKGDYQVIALTAGYWQRSRNPVTVRAKAVVK